MGYEEEEEKQMEEEKSKDSSFRGDQSPIQIEEVFDQNSDINDSIST